MKKSVFLLAFIFSFLSCAEKAKEQPADNMSVLSKSEVSYNSPVSVANVSGNDDVNGKDIADIKENITHDNEEAVYDASPSPTGNRVEPDKVKPEVQKKKIIKDGRLGLQVTDLKSAKHKVDSLVKKAGGYYANENLKNSDNQSGYELVIRIPVENFEQFVNAAENGDAKILYKEIQARDVTEEFVDLSTRLNSKRNSLARYNEIMKKANKITEILEIEQSIRVLQEEIESAEGRLRYLNDCVNYSTLNMTISTQKDFVFKPARRDSFWEKLKESMADGWYSLVDFILELFGMWPYLIIILPAGFLVWKGSRRWKRRKGNKTRVN